MKTCCLRPKLLLALFAIFLALTFCFKVNFNENKLLLPDFLLSPRKIVIIDVVNDVDDFRPKNKDDDLVVELNFRKRRQKMEDGCRRVYKTLPYKFTGPIDVSNGDFAVASRNILVNENYKFLLCSSPKVGSTNWKKVFLSLDSSLNYSSTPQNISDNEVYESKKVKTLSDFSLEEQQRILETYVKVLWTRDPFERLISAYWSKFGGIYNEYYAQVFGRQILRRHRPNASEAQIESGRGVTFSEFLAFVIDQGQLFGDVHWMAQHKVCSPCSIPYEYIGSLKGSAIEANYLLKKLTTRSDINLPPPNKKRTTLLSTRQVIANAPKRLLRKAANLYTIDYSILDYKTPQF